MWRFVGWHFGFVRVLNFLFEKVSWLMFMEWFVLTWKLLSFTLGWYQKFWWLTQEVSVRRFVVMWTILSPTLWWFVTRLLLDWWFVFR